MRKINLRKVLLLTLTIMCICLLKKNYIHSFDLENYNTLAYEWIIFWGSNPIVNLIWILPILLNLYIVAKHFYFKTLFFDMRYKNRKKYIVHILKSCYLYSLLFNFFVTFLQIAILNIFIGKIESINLSIILFFIRYALCNCLFNLMVIYISLHIKSFVYAFIIFVTVIIVGLHVLEINTHFSLRNLFFNNEIQAFEILIMIIVTFLIKKFYLFYDIGGIDK